MIEKFRRHPYTRAVCVETARLFECQAAKDLVEAQCSADQGAAERAQELQASAKLAQRRAIAWHLRARNAATDAIQQWEPRVLRCARRGLEPPRVER